MNSRGLRKAIIFCFHLIFLSVPLFFTWVNEELFEFPKMLLTYGLVITMAGLWLARMVIEKKLLIKKTFLDWPIIIFVISQTLSTIFSIHPRTSIFGYYTRFHGGLLSTLTYVTMYYALVSNVTKKELKKIGLTAIVGALIVGLYAIPEHFGHSLSCSFIAGNYDVACWKQDVQSRVFATFGQPNWLAAYAITLLPLTFIGTLFTNKKWQQWLSGITGLGLLLTLIYTQSRSGFLGFALSLGMMILGVGLIYRQKIWQVATKKFVFLMLGLLIVIAITGSPFTPSIKNLTKDNANDQAQQVSAESTQPVNRLETGGTDSGEIRKIVWDGAIKVWQRYPLLGSGVETFAYSYYQDRPLAHNNVSEWDFLYNKAHNELLNFLSTTGIVGLTAYLLLLGWFSVACLQLIFVKDKKVAPEEKLVVLALLSGLAALTVSNFFGFSTVMVTVLMYAFFATFAILKQNNSVEELAKNINQKPSEWQIFQLFIIALVTLLLLRQVRQIWKADHLFALGKQYLAAGQTETAINNLQDAIEIRPKEALFHSEMADVYAQVAVALNQKPEQANLAQQFEAAAIEQSKLAMVLNPRHLNFYKGRARVLITLAQINPDNLQEAQGVLEDVLNLAPTDAKLMYNLGLVQISLGQGEAGQATLEKAIQMRPGYEQARVLLAKHYEEAGNLEAAGEQYQYVYDHITTANETVNQKLGVN